MTGSTGQGVLAPLAGDPTAQAVSLHGGLGVLGATSGLYFRSGAAGWVAVLGGSTLLGGLARVTGGTGATSAGAVVGPASVGHLRWRRSCFDPRWR